MNHSVICFFVFCLLAAGEVRSQVDTTFLYGKQSFGAFDIRLSTRTGQLYYLKAGSTFSFRRNNGEPTNTYRRMTAWDSSPYTEGHMRERSDTADRFVMNYRMLTPRRYDPALDGGYPLVIVLHGLLERGNCAGTKCYFDTRAYSPATNQPAAPSDPDHMLLNNDYNLIHAGLDYLEAHELNGETLPSDPGLPARAFPGFVVFPQNLNGWDGAAADDAIRLVRLLSQKYNIDQNRIYINGISHGGHGAYEVLKRAPWMFAAAVMFSAADDAGVIAQRAEDRIATVPLWIFQGGLDTHPTPQVTERYVEAFRKAGGNVRYTRYADLGHGTWNRALDEPDFFTWMLGKRKNDIHIRGGNKQICATSGEGTELTLPAGYPGYEWEHNGELTGGGSFRFMAKDPGVYRGRFLLAGSGQANRWGEWSAPVTLKTADAGTARLTQTGTLLLPDLNGFQKAVLTSSPGAFFQWYKDGKLLRGKEFADTLSTVAIAPATGGGAVSVRTAGYEGCFSLASDNKQVVFNDKAPMNLVSPSEFRAEPISPSAFQLRWTDASDRETGFEIWRRRQLPDGNFSLWEMVVLTSPDATSHTDNTLFPSSRYQYKIRAVNDFERSDYFPRGQEYLAVVTGADTSAPTAPSDLIATPAGVNSIKLLWSPSSDDAGIAEYVISFAGQDITTNSADTTFRLNDLGLNTDYAFTVRAVDAAGNRSTESNTAQTNTYLDGLFYEHSTGAWDHTDAIDWSVAEFSGIVENFSLSPRTQEDFFNFKFDGFLWIEQAGIYQFRMTSDDGSRLDLNDTLLISNDGIHQFASVTSPVTLLAHGPQRITLKYFDYSLADTLMVEYKGPDSRQEWVTIPSAVLTSQMVTAAKEDDNPGNFDVRIFPNPVSHGLVNIQVSTYNSAPVSVMIQDYSGRTIVEKTPVDSFESMSLPAPETPGLYIVSIFQGDIRTTRKLLVKP